ncbi:MAG: 50S ribosomal protein L13 [Planctomycetaceae bacterium]|jgi:large subunit ribosomal protein L13|nr:50S ribosomal protein L13 [Planctomycetaceae bacterium]
MAGINDKTYMAKPNEVEQKWYLVDATDKVVGRLASDIAMILMGKHRPTYTPHIDTGEYVIVTNADKSVFTGKKLDQKKYTRYTGYTGLRSETARERFARRPELVLIESVRRMLPKNNLAKRMLQKLKVYKSGEQHPHQAQNPEALELAITRKREKVN